MTLNFHKWCTWFYLVGSIYVLLGCNNNETAKYEVFAIAAILGVSGSAMLVTSLSISASFIAENIGKENLLWNLNLCGNQNCDKISDVFTKIDTK